MLRGKNVIGFCSLTLGNLFKCEHIEPGKVYTQCIRWKRKPIWLPTAKTKVFRVPVRPILPKEEVIEIQRLYNNYRTVMKSMKAYMIQMSDESKLISNEATVKKIQEEDFLICNAINDEWNKQVAREREKRLAEEKEEKNKLVLQNLMRKEEREQNLQKIIDEKIRLVKAQRATFITRENIDKVIEEAIANVVSHDYAIDTEGNHYSENQIESGTKTTKAQL